MQKQKVKIGFIGVGSMGQCAHLKNYVVLEDVEIVALAEIRPELGRQVAKRYGVAHVYPSHIELLEHERLDGLVAAQYFGRHGQLLPELYQADIPIFSEKPLAASLAVGESIIQALKASGAYDDVGIYYFKWNGESFSKQIISYGPPGIGKGCGILFAIADITGNGCLDIVAPGKDGLVLFENQG